jgi:TerC family integral membrane protein
MEVTPLVWGLTIAAIGGLLLFDFVFHVRTAHAPTLREAAIWSGLYVGLALLFGVGVLVFGGAQPGSEYFAGYVTEKALSVDNLFVFLIIMTSFRVPREDQQKVLLFGIVFSLIARTGFIFLGAALINSFAWVFYLFGLILLLTAGNMLKTEGAESQSADERDGLLRLGDQPGRVARTRGEAPHRATRGTASRFGRLPSGISQGCMAPVRIERAGVGTYHLNPARPARRAQ